MRHNPCGHQESVVDCKECKKWDTLPKYREFWSKPGGSVMRVEFNRVSLCLHYIDARPASGHTDNRDWRRCEATGKDVCPCRDCTKGCEYYALESGRSLI